MIQTYTYASRQDWLDDRPRFVGASEVASIAQIPGAYASLWETWARKQGLLPPIEETERMRWGLRLERAIAEGFVEDNGGELDMLDMMTAYGPEGRSYCRATPDGFWTSPSGLRHVLEVKNVDRMNAEHWADDGIPVHLEAQLHWQMLCTGIDRAVIVALIGGNELVWRVVEADEAIQERLLAAVDAFWATVEQNLEPGPEARDVALLPLRWRDSIDRSAPITLDQARELVEAAAAKKASAERYDLARAGIMAEMKDAEAATLDGEPVATWRDGKRGRTFRLTKNATALVAGN